MATVKPQLDPYLFERQFAAFKKFVEEKNVVAFTSFASHPYIKDSESCNRFYLHDNTLPVLRT
jgi:hypothetical protein